MSEETKIEWASHTFNPWIGCTKVSPGCAHCYAEARDRRLGGGLHWGKGAPRQRTSTATWRNPVKWNRDVEPHPDYRARVFPSLCDWLDDEVPIEWLADFLKLIADTPNLDWLLLTKRPENAESRTNAALKLIDTGNSMWTLGGLVPHNIWFGVSVENQKTADERIPQLLQIPAAVRFLSVEPLLGPISFCECWFSLNTGPDYECEKCGLRRLMIDWVIVGGESGPKARFCNVEWIRSIVHQCKAAEVACFVKQLGSRPLYQPNEHGELIQGNETILPLNHRKGGDPAEWPADLRVREFPRPLIHH